ncbi:MAG: PIN domain-containing protein [Thaumarchaeota archaeon]|nr:PIN domain-containing protein [Nitrososphaerota archaeon]
MNGIDSSILVYAMDPTTNEHAKARDAVMALQGWALTPTVVHEVFHTLAFRRGMLVEDAKSKLHVLISDRRTKFLNITKTVSLYSLDLASEFKLGGRDSLIVGCYLHNGMEAVLTHDKDLLDLSKVRFRGRQIMLTDPIAE